MKWRNRMTRAGVIVLIYVLSFGPAVRLAAMSSKKDERTVTIGQKVLIAVYFPLAIETERDDIISEVLKWYLELWGMLPEVGPDDTGPNPA